MTFLYLTIDTEYSHGLYCRQGVNDASENYDRSIRCLTPTGEVGIFWQMDVMDAHGMKGVFFVDPLPGLIWGIEAIAAIVEPIVARGHDVQLHLHSEWLDSTSENNPLGSRTGRNIKDFTLDEQTELLRIAKNMLVEAGAPEPIAFRAGNYGANDDTLKALAANGLRYDSSFTPGISGGDCAISLPAEQFVPCKYHGMIEVPVAAIMARGATLRHGQVTAISAAEMMAALRHARNQGQHSLTLVSHSFEFMSRDRTRTNTIVKRRFESFCRAFSREAELISATYRDNPPEIPLQPDGRAFAPLPHNGLRTLHRMAEQMMGNMLYGAK